jgi:hypothetical protein
VLLSKRRWGLFSCLHLQSTLLNIYHQSQIHYSAM